MPPLAKHSINILYYGRWLNLEPEFELSVLAVRSQLTLAKQSCAFEQGLFMPNGCSRVQRRQPL